MNKPFIAENAKETQKFAVKFAKNILKTRSGKAVVIGLTGELGAGKTVFAKGFAKGLGIKEVVVSPTFVLERIYRLKGKNFKLFVHIDAYRFEKAKELSDLGFKDLIRNSHNIILIEWADNVKKILPDNSMKIKFEHIKNNQRKIIIG